MSLIETECYSLRWDRDGEVRAVPRHVIENVLREFSDELKRGVLGAIELAKLHSIRWDQCPASSADVNF